LAACYGHDDRQAVVREAVRKECFVLGWRAIVLFCGFAVALTALLGSIALDRELPFQLVSDPSTGTSLTGGFAWVAFHDLPATTALGPPLDPPVLLLRDGRGNERGDECDRDKYPDHRVFPAALWAAHRSTHLGPLEPHTGEDDADRDDAWVGTYITPPTPPPLRQFGDVGEAFAAHRRDNGWHALQAYQTVKSG